MNWIKPAVLGLLLLTLVLASNVWGVTSAQNPTALPTNTAAVDSVASDTGLVIGPFEYPENYNPLTGLPYPSEEARNRRNLIVKISNYPSVVRPQHGINAADIVYEYEAEGGVSRFAAIYRSQSPGRVGSIRSARLVDIELVQMYNALLAYSGSNEWLRQYILNSDWRWRALTTQFQDYPCPTFCRIPHDGVAYEHTLFADTDGLWAEAEAIHVNQPYQAVGLAFSETPDPATATASDIYIDWFHPEVESRWQYDATTNKYYRWDGGLPHFDAATNEQINVDNLVILEIWHQERHDVYDGVAGVAIEQQLWGYARAFVFRDGNWYQGWWYRNREYGALQLRYDYRDRNTPIHLRPGRTWFVVVRKFDAYATQGPLFSVTVSDTKVDVQATAQVVSVQATGTAQARPRIETTGTPQP